MIDMFVKHVISPFPLRNAWIIIETFILVHDTIAINVIENSIVGKPFHIISRWYINKAHCSTNVINVTIDTIHSVTSIDTKRQYTKVSDMPVTYAINPLIEVTP